MSEIEHLTRDLHDLKQEVAIIRHILSEEGKPFEKVIKQLNDARATPDSEYISHKDLKKKLLR
ncbi:hypothetical protein HY486_03725 [Candidatus Woesearchaeota archaeon]|nr:hypothetical protein [Candidatus Woesearchaeota archaeon]